MCLPNHGLAFRTASALSIGFRLVFTVVVSLSFFVRLMYRFIMWFVV